MTAFLQFCVNTLGYLRLMTVSDLIDIAILSFVFYKCSGSSQRTNAAKVAKACSSSWWPCGSRTSLISTPSTLF